VIDPRNLSQGVLERADMLVLTMIRDNWNKRPLYFSRTSGSYAQSLGLGAYVVSQGLARRLVPNTPGVSTDTLVVPGEGFVDVKRTEALWKDVFVGHNSVIRRGDWVDAPSAGIPALYVSTGLVLSDALQSLGRKTAADSVFGKAEQVARASRTIDLFGGAAAMRGQPPVAPPADSEKATAVPLGPKQ
jgi:hypothetical protein